MISDLTIPCYGVSTVVAVTGAKPVTFNAWRNRNDLFPRTQTGEGAKLYSVPDICATWVVKALTDDGCTAQYAVDVGMALLPRFTDMIRDIHNPDDKEMALVARNDDGSGPYVDCIFVKRSDPLGDLVGVAMSHVATIIDMTGVINEVLKQLLELGPHTVVVSGQSALSSVAATMAKIIAPGPMDDDEDEAE